MITQTTTRYDVSRRANTKSFECEYARIWVILYSYICKSDSELVMVEEKCSSFTATRSSLTQTIRRSEKILFRRESGTPALKPKLSKHPSPNQRHTDADEKDHGGFKDPYKPTLVYEVLLYAPVLQETIEEIKEPGMPQVNV